MKQLKIIDNCSNIRFQYQIEIQFIKDDNILSKNIIYSVTAEFKDFGNELAWYYKEYLFNPFQQYKKAQLISKNIDKEGKQLGIKIFNDELFLKLKTEDLSETVVTIESNQAAFFNIPWEILILPGSSQPLSICAKSFVRTNLNDFRVKKQYNLCNHEPLRVLLVAPRPEEYGDCAFLSNPANVIDKLLEFDQSLEVEVLPNCTLLALEERLLLKDKPIHILHFNGFANTTYENGVEPNNNLILEGNNGKADLQDIKIIAGLLGKNEIDTVFLDIYNITKANKKNNFNIVSSELALSIIKGGVNNVITTFYTSNSFSVERIYHTLYSLIGEGKSIAEAVVETRKTIKDNLKQAILTVQELDFADWPIVMHYGTRDSQFFKESVELKPLFQSKKYSEIIGNIFGFNPEFQYPNRYFGGSKEMQEVIRAFESNNSVLLKGGSGIGKTHFVHQFAYLYLTEKKAEKAFYFNFESGPLTKDQIIQIIGEVLDGKEANKDNTLQKLLKNNFLIVFDNIDYLLTESERNKTLTKEEEIEFFDFIKNIEKNNSNIILTSRKGITIPENYYYEIILDGLDVCNRRQFAAEILRATNNADEEIEPEYYELIDLTDGHPYIIKTLLSNLSRYKIKEILNDYKNELEKLKKNDIMLALYEYGWGKIPNNQKILLLALYNSKNYITDGFPIAIELPAEDNVIPGEELYQILGINDKQLAREALKNASYGGLYNKDQFGYKIHSGTVEYLKSKKEIENWSSTKESKIYLILAKVNALEIKVLASFISQNPDPKLYQKIIENLSRWTEVIELLWNNKEYNLFLSSKMYLTLILKNIGLKIEIDLFCYNLIKNIEFNSFISSATDDGILGWLSCATNAIELQETFKDPIIDKWVEQWEQYIQLNAYLLNTGVFNNVLMFLESKYKKENNWDARKKISEISINYFRNKKEYERLIISMKSLARCEEAIGNIIRCKEIENDILSDIPYNEMYEGAEQSSMLDIASNCCRRKEYDNSKKLIEKIRALPNIASIHFFADNLEGEIFYSLEDFVNSAIHFSRIWREIMRGLNISNPQKIAIKLKDLHKKLGEDKFMEIFKKEAPDVKSPVELENQSRLKNNLN